MICMYARGQPLFSGARLLITTAVYKTVNDILTLRQAVLVVGQDITELINGDDP